MAPPIIPGATLGQALSTALLLVLLPFGPTCSKPAAGPAHGPVESVAQRAIEAIAARDFGALAELAHPTRGVRFSPYAYVDTESDVVLSAAELRAAGSDAAVRVWGRYDGSGEPIEMTLADYWSRFVYDADFARADEIAWDRRLGIGNSLDNSKKAYPKSRIVEYHFDGFDADLDGLDWRSLRLAFKREGGRWYLVGFIHDQWTT